jgi:hypothetical protein
MLILLANNSVMQNAVAPRGYRTSDTVVVYNLETINGKRLKSMSFPSNVDRHHRTEFSGVIERGDLTDLCREMEVRWLHDQPET